MSHMFFNLEIPCRKLRECLLSRTRTNVSAPPYPTGRPSYIDSRCSTVAVRGMLCITYCLHRCTDRPPIVEHRSYGTSDDRLYQLIEMFRFPSQAFVTLITHGYVGAITLIEEKTNAPLCSFYSRRLLRSESFPPFHCLIWFSDDHQ